MTATVVAAIAALALGWSVLSGLLARRNITGPLLFTAAGYLLGNPDWGLLSLNIDAGSVHLLAEVALALVLFSDAARVNVHELRRDVSLPARLLGVGLVLSVAAGALLATRLVAGIPWGLAGFTGAALAPTDAALSVQVINDEQIPNRLRRALNVESGLNDGIVTPVVTVMLAAAASQLGVLAATPSFEIGRAVRELGVGVAVGLGAGMVGAWSLSLAARRGWTATGGRRLAAVSVAVGAYATAVAIEANGFIAAFVAGIAFGAALDRSVVEVARAEELPELGGELLALVVWFLFGATLVPIAFGHLDGRVALYALLSLTVVRMVPVGVSLLGSGLDRPSIAFIAWFGPRGLASVVFALLAIEELGPSSAVADRAVGAVALTVLASVVLHGVTAGPGGRRYVQREEHEAAGPIVARPQWFGGGTKQAKQASR